MVVYKKERGEGEERWILSGKADNDDKREEGEHEKEGAKVRSEKRGVRIGIIMAGEARGAEGKVKQEGETRTEKQEEKYGREKVREKRWKHAERRNI